MNRRIAINAGDTIKCIYRTWKLDIGRAVGFALPHKSHINLVNMEDIYFDKYSNEMTYSHRSFNFNRRKNAIVKFYSTRIVLTEKTKMSFIWKEWLH